MNNMHMALEVEELESLDAATEDETEAFWVGVGVGVVAGVLIGLT